MRLSHIHLPGLTSYVRVGALQSFIARRLLDHRAQHSRLNHDPEREGGELSNSLGRYKSVGANLASDATLITFQPPPTYTCGNRDRGRLTAEEVGYLIQPLESPSEIESKLERKSNGSRSLEGKHSGGLPSTSAVFISSERGGQITFHGPGQLVGYVIADLKTHAGGIGIREYVHRLEEALIRTCAHFGVRAGRTNQTGVWTGMQEKDERIEDDKERRDKVRNALLNATSPSSLPSSSLSSFSPENELAGPRKVAAIGVHLRRYVTTHGLGLNVTTDLRWFRRITACGLDGRRTTSLKNEGVIFDSMDESETIETVASVLATQVAENVLTKVEGVTPTAVDWDGVDLDGLDYPNGR